MKSGKVKTQDYVCPWWLIRSFDNPLRSLIQNPDIILQDLVNQGFICLDLGCGYGYYSIAMAKMVGENGRVTAVDIQPRMLEGTRRRAEKQGLLGRIDLQLADSANLELPGDYDFALAFWMMHEVKDQFAFVRSVYGLLKSGGNFMIVEPKIHVNKASFNHSAGLVQNAGFNIVGERNIFFSRALLFEKNK